MFLYRSQNKQGLFQNTTLTGLCVFSRRKVFTARYEPKSGGKVYRPIWMSFVCKMFGGGERGHFPTVMTKSLMFPLVQQSTICLYVVTNAETRERHVSIARSVEMLI